MGVKRSTRLTVWLLSTAIALSLVFVVEPRYLPLVLPGPFLAGALLLTRLESGTFERGGRAGASEPRQSRLLGWLRDHGLYPTTDDPTGIVWRSAHPWIVSLYGSLIIGVLVGLTTSFASGQVAVAGIAAVALLSLPILRITGEVERRRFARRRP